MSLLETAQRKSSDPALVEGQIRKRIREIVRAYRHSWDVYSELIQNSVDAINRRYKILNDPDFSLYEEYRRLFPELESDPAYTGRIKITVNVPNREIEICDNGVGIRSEYIEEFLLPEGTDKHVGQEYGFKGFGLTFVAFISQEFYLASRYFVHLNESAYEFGLNGLFSWLVNDNSEGTFPAEPIPDVRPATQRLDGEWNTIVRLKLPDDYASRFPAVSSAEQAIELVNEKDKLKGFEFVLRTRTAAGNTRPLFNEAAVVPINIELSIVFPSGDSESTDIPYRYFHPKEHDEVSVISYDFRDYFEQYKRPSVNKNFRALYHVVPDKEVGTRRIIKCDFALAAIASRRLSNIESDLKLDEIESGDVRVTYGVHLAINGMPTGLRIDDWDTKGAYLKRFYVIVDTDLEISNQLDPGRKGISQYYARLISDKALALIGNSIVEDSEPFASYASKHLDHGRGPEEGSLPPQDFQIRIGQVRQQGAQQQQEDVELLNTLRRLSDLIYFPTDEQEVIALFYELLMQKIIKGYRTVYLAGSGAVYDAAFEYEIECDETNTFPGDPLGIGKVLVQDLRSRGLSTYVHRNHYSGRTALPELCVEFKRSIGGFLEEINRPHVSSKDPNLINLLISWDTSIPASVPQQMYTIDPVFDNRRFFHSTTHRLGIIGSQNTEVQCIVLREVLGKFTEGL